MNRRGFTLTEMLVATIVFLVGFVAVFGLFLGGMRMRKLSEDTTRASLAASCIIDEIRANAGGGNVAAPALPDKYVGDGFATTTTTGKTDSGITACFYPYQPIPGTWYRVLEVTDINGGDDDKTTVLHLKLLVLPFNTTFDLNDPTSYPTFDQLNKRLGLKVVPATQATIASELVARGIAFQFQAVITRRPSWLP